MTLSTTAAGGPARQAPINSLVEEVQVNQSEAHQALKFGNVNHLSSSQADVTP